jgi:hypothetical protein
VVRPATTTCGAKSLANAATTFRRRSITERCSDSVAWRVQHAAGTQRPAASFCDAQARRACGEQTLDGGTKIGDGRSGLSLRTHCEAERTWRARGESRSRAEPYGSPGSGPKPGAGTRWCVAAS